MPIGGDLVRTLEDLGMPIEDSQKWNRWLANLDAVSKQVGGKNVDGIAGLSDISPWLGTVLAGEFRCGNRKVPGDTFTGIRMGYPGFTYGSDTWSLVGVNSDTLQAGLRAADGKFLAGAGAVILDANGLSLNMSSGSATSVSDIYWNDESGNDIIYTATSYTAVNGVATWLLLMGSGGSTKAANHLKLEARNSGDAGIAAISLLGQSGSTEVVINDGATIANFRVEGATDADLFVINASNDAVQIGEDASSKVGFYGATPVTKPTEITDELTTITHTAPGTPDYAIADLTAGGFGFVAKDEGNTVLSVVANLQARVNELENTLSSLGLVTDAD